MQVDGSACLRASLITARRRQMRCVTRHPVNAKPNGALLSFNSFLLIEIFGVAFLCFVCELAGLLRQ